MKKLEDSVLSKMNFQRIKAHRTSVLAHISKEFYEYTLPYGCDCTDCRKSFGTRIPVNHDTEQYKEAIAYRNKVNKYYDALKNATKVK